MTVAPNIAPKAIMRNILPDFAVTATIRFLLSNAKKKYVRTEIRIVMNNKLFKVNDSRCRLAYAS